MVTRNRARLVDPLPVHVYLHGGAFTRGGIAYRPWQGETMARKQNIVSVIIQYRLGILGFAALPELEALTTGPGSGLYGLLDQTLALKWVKAHIGAFGGDPARITLGGESAGGHSVCFHLAYPPSQRLFTQAVMASFACPLPKPAGAGATYTRRLIDTNPGAGCSAMRGAALVGCLRALHEGRLLHVSRARLGV